MLFEVRVRTRSNSKRSVVISAYPISEAYYYTLLDRGYYCDLEEAA